jgi:hypothetical protein
VYAKHRFADLAFHTTGLYVQNTYHASTVFPHLPSLVCEQDPEHISSEIELVEQAQEVDIGLQIGVVER